MYGIKRLKTCDGTQPPTTSLLVHKSADINVIHKLYDGVAGTEIMKMCSAHVPCLAEYEIIEIE